MKGEERDFLVVLLTKEVQTAKLSTSDVRSQMFVGGDKNMKKQYDRKRAFLERFWRGEDVGRPAWQFSWPGNKLPVLEVADDPYKYARSQLAAIKEMEARGIADDYIPCLTPYFGTGALASAFGAELVWEGSIWTKPVIRDNASDVYKLKPPKLTDGVLGRVLKTTEVFLEESHGDYPVRPTDIQSPLDTASLIWNYTDFLTAMYTSPKEVHHILTLVADFIGEFVLHQRELCGENFSSIHFPRVWAPPDFCLSMSDDVMVLLSPNLYGEFGVTYNDRAARDFDGVLLHTCGDASQNLDVLLEHKNLKAFDFGVTETPFEKVVEKLSGRCILLARVGLNVKPHFDSSTEFARFVLERIRKDTLSFMLLRGPDEHTQECLEYLKGEGVAEV